MSGAQDQAAVDANVRAADEQVAKHAAEARTQSQSESAHDNVGPEGLEQYTQDAEAAMGVPRPRAADPRQLTDEALDFAKRMFDLARAGDATLIEYLKAGLPPNLTNNRGDSLLMLAAYHGHASLVKSMLTELPRPSDPNQLNGKSQSPVAGAVFKGYDEVVKVLIEGGADPLAGQPTAEETAQMFNKFDGDGGFRGLFANAPGRGKGATDAAPPVEDREQARRVPGQGSTQDNSAQESTGAPPIPR